MWAINSDGIEFLDDLSRVTQVTDDDREKTFLYQRLSVGQTRKPSWRCQTRAT